MPSIPATWSMPRHPIKPPLVANIGRMQQKVLSPISARCRPVCRYMKFTPFQQNCTWGPNEATQSCLTSRYTVNIIRERRSPSRWAAHYRGQNASVAPISHAALTLCADAPQPHCGAPVAYYFEQSSNQYVRCILEFSTGGLFITAEIRYYVYTRLCVTASECKPFNIVCMYTWHVFRVVVIQ